jgi:hypothetical protein
MATPDSATVAKARAWSGAIGNVVISSGPINMTAVSFNGGAAGGTFTVYDNATTNAGTILFQATLAAAQIDTVPLPIPLFAKNGITINASAALGAGSVHVY